jgi:hypothetical protein
VWAVGGDWSASRPGKFTPGERTLGTDWIRGWMGPRTGLDDVKNGKSCTYRHSKSDPSTVQPVTSRGSHPLLLSYYMSRDVPHLLLHSHVCITRNPEGFPPFGSYLTKKFRTDVSYHHQKLENLWLLFQIIQHHPEVQRLSIRSPNWRKDKKVKLSL